MPQQNRQRLGFFALRNLNYDLHNQPFSRLRQQIADSDSADLATVEYDRYDVSRSIGFILAIVRLLSRAARFSVRFDYAVDKIHDPVHRDARLGINLLLETAVPRQ